MFHLDDGRAAISYEDRGGTIRVLAELPDADDTHPAYVAVGQVTRLANGIAVLHAFAGKLTTRHMRLIVRLLVGQGYRTAYIDRASGHAIPLAEKIQTGDWIGWWRLDLESVPTFACG